ncbi:hypothetical protein BGW39_011589 [Mortierella sp. 14UC]|nr:hypothetical protein BGW39_011589 [Mortierella sp. 14UC]
MGGSGSGKTTLLNVLAGRVDKSQIAISGDMHFNAQHPKVFRKSGEVGYLQQEDKLLPSITVRETLDFTAKLRLPTATTKQERQGVVESLISILGLKDCADVRVGDADANESGEGGRRGISGGERRRVSAAIQLLTRPSLLLCDEITSGLDSFTSFELVKTLNTYAKTSNKTVILSIHQPRSEIYHMLSESDGQLVLLSNGRVVYSGPMNQALAWFESMGVEPCPVDMNPLDYIMDKSVLFKHNPLQDVSKTPISHALHIKTNTNDKTTTSEQSLDSPGSNVSFSGVTLNRIDSFAAGELMRETQQDQGQGSRNKHILGSGTPRGVSLWTQVAILAQRNWLNARRNALYFWGVMAVYVVFAILVGAAFWRLDGGVDGIRGRASVLYALGAFQPYMVSMLGVYKGVADMKVYDRERKERLYSPAAFIISYSICQIPVNIVATLLHSIIVYYMVGLRTDGIYWIGWHLGVGILLQCTISATTMLSIALERDFDRAALVGASLFLCSSMTNGFIIPTNQIPKSIRWIETLSYHRIAYQTWISLEFTDRRFDCPFHLSHPAIPTTSSNNNGPWDLWDPVYCKPWEGNTILMDQLQGKPYEYPNQMIYFAAHYFGYLLLAWLVLTFFPKKDALASSRKSPFENMFLPFTRLFVSKAAKSSRGKTIRGQDAKERESLGKEVEEVRVDISQHDREQPPLVPVTIQVENLSMSLVEQSLFERAGFGSSEGRRKTLLDNIDVVIPPAKLTAILGGSGSGKTTLLNALLHRTQAGMHISGDIYFNGSKNPSVGQINTVSGYVRQGDGMLMTHLTVRETLSYAVELGMSKNLSLARKRARVENVIELMGLQECANVMIGNSEKSGCSGGQRRRVSIGMQLVNEPTCLFLDEPTTGLDALTALSVIQTLKKIAASGRTVVCTIHQPRVDIWDEFDDVLLLVNGGRLAYAGRSDQVRDHFERAGHPLPPYTNPPDFIIDTASVNFRSHEQEAASRATIDALAMYYQHERTKSLLQSTRSDTSSSPTGANGIGSSGRSEDTLGTDIPHHAGLIAAASTLTRRMFKNAFRQRGAYLNRFMSPFITTVIFSTFYWGLEDSPVGLLNRIGFFHQLMGGALSGLIIHAEVFPKEREIAFREMSNGSYSATSFLVSYMFVELPITLLSSCLTTLAIMTITGLRATLASVLVMILILFAFITTGESLGIAYSCYFASNSGLGLTLMNSIIIWFSFLAGFLIAKLPYALQLFNYISIFKYAAIALSLEEFRGLQVQLDNSADGGSSILALVFPSGDAVLSYLKMDDQDLGFNLCMIVVLIVVYRLAAWAVLTARIRSLLA